MGLLLRAFHNFRYGSLVFRSLIWLNVIAILPIVLLGLLGNWYSQTTLRHEVKQSSLQMLEQTQRLMDVLFNEIDTSALDIVNSPSLSKIYNQKKIDTNLPALSEINSKLLDLYVSSPYINSVYVYYKKANEVQTPLGGLYSLDHFNDIGWISNINNIGDQAKWVVRSSSMMNANPQQNTGIAIDSTNQESVSIDEGNQVTLIRPFPLLNSPKSGAIIVNLNQMAFFQSPSFKRMRKDEQIWMVSPDNSSSFDNVTGALVPMKTFKKVQKKLKKNSSQFEEKIGKIPYSFNFVTSSTTGWKYVDVIPAKILYKNNDAIQTFMIILGILCSILAITFVLFMTKRIYHPIYYLIDLVQRNSKEPNKSVQLNGKSEFTYLKEVLETLKDKDIKQEKRIKEAIPILRQNFLNNILHEETENIEERINKLTYYDLKVSHYPCFVCVMRIDDYPSFVADNPISDQSRLRYFILKLSEEMASIHFNAMSVNTENKDIILICNQKDQQEKDEIRKAIIDLMKTINHFIGQNLKLTLSIGIGDSSPNIGNVSKSYKQALDALEGRAYKGYEAVVAFWEYQPHYTLDFQAFEKFNALKRDLLITIQKTDEDKINQFVEKLNRIMDEAQNYPFGIIKHELFDIVVIALQKSKELGVEPNLHLEWSTLYKKSMELETIEQMVHWVKNILFEILNNLNNIIIHHKSESIRKILDYVHVNYFKDISLSGISEQLNLDPAYVSRLFKQEMKINFLEYVISLRLRKAKELLIKTNISVKEIGLKVGYPNQHSFIRMFKKQENTTPGKYRELVNPATLDNDSIY